MKLWKDGADLENQSSENILFLSEGNCVLGTSRILR